MGEGDIKKQFTIGKSIKSVKSLKIKIIDFVDTRTLGNCKKISCEYEVYTGHDKLGDPQAHLQWSRPSKTSPRCFLRLGLKETFMGQYYNGIFPIDQRCDVKLN